jgi:hypothetical protein
MSRLATPLSVLAVAGASIALVACGGSSGGNSAAAGGGATSTTGQNGTQSAAFQKFQQCLKDNGVTLPDRGNRQGGGYGPPAGGGQPPTSTNGTPPAGAAPGGPGFGQGDAKTQKAMQACAKYRPQGAGRGGYGNGNGAGRPQQNIKAFTPYLTCLKDQGLDVKVSDGFNALRDLKQDDPKVQAAFKACQSKLPQRPQQGTSTATTTTGAAT